ncbi:MAG: L-glutamate gamma-semialdehyde dehydrogenase [Bdellovibrio sp.]|nr:MAG: L-glutamate gamma-semialdehyde dehydrogenase [Bdellovibrio sp.]
MSTESVPPAKSPEQNQLVETLGKDILRSAEKYSKLSLFSKDYWYGSIMDWSMKNEKFKTQLFRFVDVLPSLQSGAEVARHLREYFAEAGDTLPAVFNVGLGLGSLAPSLMAGAIRKNVTQMAKLFITGEDAAEALPVLRKLRKESLTFTLDILGEATLSESEALDYQKRYEEMIDRLAEDTKSWAENPQIDRDHQGPIPKVNVSVKLTALYSQINEAWDENKEKLKQRLRPLFRKAQAKLVFLNLDMENFGVKDLTLEIFRELVLEPEFRSYPFFGCVIQAYLRDSLADIERLIACASSRGTPFTIRLVKGAYWDFETIEARQKGWPIPVYLNKAESDASFEDCSDALLGAFPSLRVAFGSHNVRSIAHALVEAERLGIPRAAVEVQMLYGMADPIKKALVEKGYRVREYAPVGELIPGMAYLVRRLLENTSNESWLRGKFAEGLSPEKLLRDPHENLVRSHAKASREYEVFHNEPLKDFADSNNRQSLASALREFHFEKHYFPVVDGKVMETAETLTRENPSRPSQRVGIVHLAGEAEAEAAVRASMKAAAPWRQRPAEERAALLERLADLMSRDRFRLIATQVFEVGKPAVEADAEVAEAIDFCRYYAREMRRLAPSLRAGRAPGENSQYHYQARGLTLVIAPWNFPLAILAGMTVAALVTGNTVIMKPAEQSSIVGAGLMDLLREAGFPAGVAHFLPGQGEIVGEYLVQHKDVATIAFTGSRTVGLHILQRSSVVQTGQKHIKRALVELGGKNAILIDSDADLDEAVDGVLYSAFGFAGQKCSACSRAIVLDEVYDRFVARLVEAAKSLSVGEASNPVNYYGPVVDREAFARIKKTIETAKGSHPVAYEGAPLNHLAGGYFIPPTIFASVDPRSKLAQEEIFGPVLAIIRVKNFSEAIEVANGVDYGLTGGVFSRSPNNIEQASTLMECGNLYINRGITGALVDRHPFGGFKMSGVGSKTGGPDYLHNFMEPRCVTENTVRRGFAPEERS